MHEGEGAKQAGEVVQVDETDREIISELKKDARKSYRELAREVGISASTLISRMNRLEKGKVIRGYEARLDLSRMGYDFFALVEVTFTRGASLELQQKIAAMQGISAVYDITGDSDSMALAKCRNRQEFSRLVKKIGAIPGVERTNTHVILNVVKEE
ncbi:MAG: Lrp/AsnC family transcriptional regulator [Candidatus Micrarchaeia archaeon]